MSICNCPYETIEYIEKIDDNVYLNACLICGKTFIVNSDEMIEDI